MVAVAVEPFFTTYTNSYIKEKKSKHLRENIQDFRQNYLGEMKEKVGLLLERRYSPVHAFYIPRADAKHNAEY